MFEKDIIINNCRWGGRSGGGVYNAGPCSAGSLLSLLPSSFFLPFFCVLFFFFFFLASVLFLPSSLILPNPSQAIPSHRHPIPSHPIAIQSFEMDRARLQAIAAHFQKKGCCRNSHPGWLETGLAPPPHSLHDGSGPVAKRAPAARRARGAGEAGRRSSEK